MAECILSALSDILNLVFSQRSNIAVLDKKRKIEEIEKLSLFFSATVVSVKTKDTVENIAQSVIKISASTPKVEKLLNENGINP